MRPASDHFYKVRWGAMIKRGKRLAGDDDWDGEKCALSSILYLIVVEHSEQL